MALKKKKKIRRQKIIMNIVLKFKSNFQIMTFQMMIKTTIIITKTKIITMIPTIKQTIPIIPIMSITMIITITITTTTITIPIYTLTTQKMKTVKIMVVLQNWQKITCYKLCHR
jgi:thiamine pyrophosphokinase